MDFVFIIADREAASLLEKKNPLRPFNHYIKKYSAQGYSEEALWQKL